MYVVDDGKHGELALEASKKQWDDAVALEFSNQLEKHPYICGHKFNAADIMVINYHRPINISSVWYY